METAQIYDRVWPAAYSFAVFHTNSAKQYPSAIVHGATTDSQGMYPSPNSMFLKRETDLNFTRIPFCVSHVHFEQHSKFQQRRAFSRFVLAGYFHGVEALLLLRYGACRLGHLPFLGRSLGNAVTALHTPM